MAPHRNYGQHPLLRGVVALFHLAALNQNSLRGVPAANAATPPNADFPGQERDADDPQDCEAQKRMYATRLTDAAAGAFRVWPQEQITPDAPSTYSPPAMGQNHTSFVVLTAPRSASNSLDVALSKPARSPYVQMAGEVWGPGSVHGRFGQYGWTPELRDANRTEFMRLLFELDEPPALTGALARGFKVFPWHLTESELRLITSQKHVLKIVLRRQDTLSQYVSILRAASVGYWGSPEHKSAEVVEAFDGLKVPVCVEAYEKYVEAHASWYDWFAKEAQEHPESWQFVSTERLTADPHAMLAIYAALGVPPGELLEYSPYTSDSLEAKVSNYDDVKDILPEIANQW